MKANWFCPTCSKMQAGHPGRHTCKCGTKSTIKKNGDTGFQINTAPGPRPPAFVVENGELKRRL